MDRLERVTGVFWVSRIASIAIVVAALSLAKGLLVPFTLAVLLSFLLAPLCDTLERFRCGRVPAVLMATMIAFAVLGVVGWTVTVQISELAGKLPEYKENISGRVHSLNDHVGGALRKIARTSEEIGRISTPDSQEGVVKEERAYPVRLVTPPTQAFQLVGRMFGTLLDVLATASIVIIFVIFFLLRREDLRDRFIRLVGQGQVTLTTQALDDAAGRVSRYLVMQLAINTFFGLSVAIGLYFIGIPNAILWGLLATALRFIPYVGPWVAASMPILLSLAITNGWTKPMMTVGLFVALELVINNVLEPWLYGSRTGVSPVAVLAAAVFWTWLWGGPGLLLATPLTVCLAVLGKYVPQLRFLDILLGDQPAFDEKTRVYQRLLAGDPEEAMDLIAQRFKETSMVDVYDSLLLPALAIAEKERHSDELDEFRHRFVCESLREMTDEIADWEEERRTQGGGGSQPPHSEQGRIVPVGLKVCVLCLPARDTADEIAANMLARVLQLSGCCAETVSVTALASEMVELVAERDADVVCVSAMPPAATAHARYLCKRLHTRFPEMKMVVGIWSEHVDLSGAKERLACGEARVVSKLSDALEQVRSLIQPVLVQAESGSGAIAAGAVPV